MIPNQIPPEVKQLSRRLAVALDRIRAAQRDCPADEFTPEEARDVFEFDLQKWILEEQAAGNITLAPKTPVPEDTDKLPAFLTALYREAPASN